MDRMFRIGVLGLTHDHVWGNLEQLQQSEKGELIAVADEHPELLEKARQQYGCVTYSHPDSLLGQEELDAVYLYADNASSVHLGEQAALRGLHLLMEKPLAANRAGADRLCAAVHRAGVRLMVNWPFAWWPQLQHALRLAKEGAIGRLWEVKYRAAHEGPREMGCSEYFSGWLEDPQRNGAGALMDYCCYGVLLARCLLGMPSRVMGVTGRLCKQELSVEDNALLVLSYAGALAVAEASWTQVGKLTSYITVLHGTTGTLLVEPRAGGKLLLATTAEPNGTEVPVPEPAPELRSASAHFLHGLETGADFQPLCDGRFARDTQEILEGGLISAGRGAEVSLPLRYGMSDHGSS